ncbi:DUF1684 domain-containing protein [Aliikangiella marina]|uniref:DUF1684 domain-containing protein n=1 Tax=Aliikangiella marina TaxID=1712262 RepID=A0A545T6T0_9GAMM|nr:DUF1684 domain-containing protein [Aliikangiella marina]TQV72888.1 DUF1684 domain-containing protein [Aliikangiella marina]
MATIKFVVTTLIIFSLFSCASNPQPDYLGYWQQWKTDYEKGLKGKGGWLSLAGLYWLEPGENSLGSDSSNEHRFPAHAPKQVGIIQVKNKQVFFESRLNNLMIDGQIKKSAILSIKEATPVSFENFEFFVIEREGNYAIRLIDNNSPIANSYHGSKFYPFDQSAIVKAKLTPHKEPTIISVATVYGTNRKEKSAGFVDFTYKGKKGRLEVVDYGPDSPLYLLFGDTTNGKDTYDAGRYLKFARPDESGKILLDFNRAYNPPCAFTDYATCPLIPPQNRLSFSIEAGEKNYEKRD